MKRIAVAALALLAIGVSDRASAQDVQQQAYRSKRDELVKELQQAQAQLADLRSQRVQLQARIENVIAQMMQQRAQALLMSNEANALQQLDAMLTSSQDNLLAQRDRFTTIADAVRRRSGSMLVVLLRADSSSGAGQILGNATLQVDNASVENRTYNTTSNGALRMGAVDQLYRADVLPTSHTVTLQITVNGQPMTQTMNVTAAGETVTYVQFAVRNGQVVPTTWTSRGTTPF
ncbi:MAG TPA: hypothetical protein VHM30_02310 [Gemmatimonadaceae bacterium]|nr:hypothetical protein [Gemmatimonadaceae bacterium]